jgi:predicted nucleic acid-binding protein
MILVDSSVWIDHLRTPEPRLSRLLTVREALVHPFVLGEIVLGFTRGQPNLVEVLRDAPQAPVAEPDEVLAFVEMHGIGGRGIGYVDAHLLASTLLLPDTLIWSRDRRLAAVADTLGIAADLA